MFWLVFFALECYNILWKNKIGKNSNEIKTFWKNDSRGIACLLAHGRLFGRYDRHRRFRIFTNIMIPLISPVIKSLFVIQFINLWNDYGTAMLYLPKAPTLSYGLYMFEQQMQYKGANYPVYFAGCGLALIPILILFVSFQNVLMENMTAGGLKG